MPNGIIQIFSKFKTQIDYHRSVMTQTNALFIFRNTAYPTRFGVIYAIFREIRSFLISASRSGHLTPAERSPVPPEYEAEWAPHLTYH